MAFGISITDVNNKYNLVHGENFVRLIDSISIPLDTTQSYIEYTVPNFDDTQGLFTWYSAGFTRYNSSGHGYLSSVSLPFTELHWNNNTKVFRYTAYSTSITFENSYLYVNFFHYR